jgi:hypothetical protein
VACGCAIACLFVFLIEMSKFYRYSYLGTQRIYSYSPDTRVTRVKNTGCCDLGVCGHVLRQSTIVMSACRLSLLLVVLAAASASGTFIPGAEDFNLGDAVRGLPGSIKSNLRRFRSGCGEMWDNSKQAKLVQRSVMNDGHALSYAELILLRQSSEDFSKLLRAGAIWLFAPELLPAMLYFYPRAMPSTFESEEGRDRRRGSLARMRTTSCLELLATLEEQAATAKGSKALLATASVERAEQLLRARSVGRALVFLHECATPPKEDEKAHKPLQKVLAAQARSQKRGGLRVGKTSGAGKAALLGLSQPALKAGCKMIGVSGPQPGPLRRGALGKHLENLVQEDAVLSTQGTAALGREELLEACLDRGFGSSNLKDAELRKLLDEWLALIRARDGAEGFLFEPHRLRLAAMGACSAAALRREGDSMSVLPRLVYQ